MVADSAGLAKLETLGTVSLSRIFTWYSRVPRSVPPGSARAGGCAPLPPPVAAGPWLPVGGLFDAVVVVLPRTCDVLYLNFLSDGPVTAETGHL